MTITKDEILWKVELPTLMSENSGILYYTHKEISDKFQSLEHIESLWLVLVKYDYSG